jgi:hypothetical protein
MTALPVLLLLTGAVGLGLLLGVFYLRGVRRPVLIGVHLLLGAGGLEGMVVLLHGTPSGDVLQAGTFGMMALGLFALAMLSGLTAPLVSKGSRRTADVMVATHASVGVIGFVLFITWVAMM